MDIVGSDIAQISSFRGMRPATLWAIRALAISALGLSLFLLWTSIRLSGPIGCGTAAGCEQVLTSRWSKWLGIPVSGPAAAIYLAILIGSCWLDSRSDGVRRRAAMIVSVAAVVAAGAAIWFVYLQVAVVENICPYCLAAHTCGLLIAGLLILNLRIALSRPARMVAASVGVASVAILIAGQIFVRPQTYQMDVAGPATETSCPPDQAVVSSAPDAAREPAAVSPYGPLNRASSYATQASYAAPDTSAWPASISTVPIPGAPTPGAPIRTAPVPPTSTAAAPLAPAAAPPVASFHLPGAWFDLMPSKVPCVGSQTAAHFILMISDYACPHCRASHHLVSQVLRRYDGQISLLVLPMPLDRKCNPQLLETEAAPEPQDCALNRLALAVWCADPNSYAQIDAWLFAADRSRQEAEARNYATLLVGASQLERAESDRRIDAVLRLDSQLYARAKGGALPKLLLGSTMISGLLEDPQPLEQAIEKEWHLQPTRP